jgi:hypothetical protein
LHQGIEYYNTDPGDGCSTLGGIYFHHSPPGPIVGSLFYVLVYVLLLPTNTIHSLDSIITVVYFNRINILLLLDSMEYYLGTLTTQPTENTKSCLW